MSKQKISYSCNSCSYQTVKWMGCCPGCSSWDSFEEQKPVSVIPGKLKPGNASEITLFSLDQIPHKEQTRLVSGIQEWDRVVGNGLMNSSLNILTGDPGIGKSTLLLQISHALAQEHEVFYCSTEESLHQVKMRAQRLKCTTGNLKFSDQANLSSIIARAEQDKPHVLIIDSIQNCYIPHTQSSPGSMTQLRESTFALMRLAKEHQITIIMTGHITKEGIIAGPKTIEHMVDAVFYLQGEDRWNTRILRGVKNRFGTINELGFFEMHEEGLIQVPNINELILNEASHAPGAALVSVVEGSRPLIIELQALTIESKLGMPQRVISGVDHKQVVLIAAILEKYLNIKLSMHDLFFKVSGGFKTKSSSIDVGIACALLSSYFKQPLPERTIILGELSLTGAIKPINQVSQFVRDAVKFGVRQVIVAKQQHLDDVGCQVTRVGHIYELLMLFQE